MDVGLEGEGCFRGVKKEEKDVVCLVQFSIRSHRLGRLSSILDQKDLQLPPEDSASLIKPFSCIEQSLGAFSARISPSAHERNERSNLERGLTIHRTEKDEDEEDCEKGCE